MNAKKENVGVKKGNLVRAGAAGNQRREKYRGGKKRTEDGKYPK